MTPRNEQVLARIWDRPELEVMVQSAITESLDATDPQVWLCCWLVNNLEEGDESPELHSCWLPGADCADLAMRLLEEHTARERALREEEFGYRRR